MNYSVRLEAVTNGYVAWVRPDGDYIGLISPPPVGTHYEDMDALKKGLPDLLELALLRFTEIEERRKQEEKGMAAQKQAYHEQSQSNLNQAAQGRFYDYNR